MSSETNKKIMAKNIRKYMERKGVTNQQLCGDLNFKYTTFLDWKKAISYPRIGRIEAMANYFGCEKSDLIEDNSSVPVSKAHRIPVLGNVAAGIPIEMVEDIIDYEEIPANWGNKEDFFCLQIKGDSMQPKMDNGDVVVVKKQTDADSNDIVIFAVNGDTAACKRLKKTETGVMFISTNSHYDPIFFTWDEVRDLPVRILGKVVELRAKF